MSHLRRFPIRWIVGVVSIAFLFWRVRASFVEIKLEIGPDTTVVSGPWTRDHRIDYCKALHLRLSDGILAADNAAVLIDRAFGPGAIPAELRPQYFEWMGVEPLPEQGDYVLTQSALMTEKAKSAGANVELRDAMQAEFGRAQLQPWKHPDCPQAAEWLDANARPLLELITQAAQCKQYYSPLVSAETLFEARTTVQNLREVVRLLMTRAMLRLGEDDIRGAWSDVLACHRLSRLVSQHAPDVVSFLVATSIEASATMGDAALIANGLSAEQARTCLAEYDRLPNHAWRIGTAGPLQVDADGLSGGIEITRLGPDNLKSGRFDNCDRV